MKKVITISATALAILSMFFISSGVYATEASSDTEVDLELATVLNITTPETSNINCVSLNTLCTSTATVTVGTNNSTGYTLQLNATSGYSNSLTNAATSETIPTLTGAYAAGSFPTNYWGYTGGLDKSGETGGYNCSTNYCPVLAYQSNDSNYAPNHVIKTVAAPASESTTITFGAKADVTKSSGTYSTSVTFTAVANYVPVNCAASGITCEIVYDNNGSTSNNGISYTHTNPTLNDTIDLFPGNDYKTDYGFAGWSTDPNAGSKVSSSNASTRNSVTVYGPMETVTVTQELLDANIDGTITLYAVWVPSAGTMQSFSTTNCNNLAQTTYDSATSTIIPGQITARKDSRDNNTYAIARLSDGKCWMMENLRLDQNITLNSTNTQNPAISTTPVNSTAIWNKSGATVNRLRNDNIASPTSNATAMNASIYSYGVYYPWYTATAGRNPSSGNTTGSICPRNWSMPYSSETYNSTAGSFYYLANTMDATSGATKRSSFIHYPNNFIFSGYVTSGSIYVRGFSGYYWPRTGYSSNHAYFLGFNKTQSTTPQPFYPSNYTEKYDGYSVRCIAGS